MNGAAKTFLYKSFLFVCFTMFSFFFFFGKFLRVQLLGHREDV